MDGWTPDLQGDGLLHERLLRALEDDIRTGALAPGAKLPPHRDLARTAGVSVGTVTKAYAEAERRGLVVAHVGRGSFVSGGDASGRIFPLSTRPTDGAVDLARNYPPADPARQRLQPTLARLRARADLSDVLTYAPPDGLPGHRAAVAQWLVRRYGLTDVRADDILLCCGGQQAISLSLSVLCRPGDPVLCEAATFHGFRALAEHAGYRPVGVALDAEGLIPEGLDRAAASTGARVLYTIPTLQNPTGATMSEARRQEIVRVAQMRNLIIVEDDVYAPYARATKEPTPLRNLAPNRVWHVASASKTLVPGLRVGFVTTPQGADRDPLLRAARASHYAPPGLTSMILAQWIEDGTADSLADVLIEETGRRRALAARVLGRPLVKGECPHASHLWLAMGELEAERAAGRAMRGGVEVTPPSAPIVDPSLISGLRLCLGAAPDLAALERGLHVVAASLASGAEEPFHAMV